jgi:hypothetical protein
MMNRPLLLTMLVVPILLSGCSNDLSRTKASAYLEKVLDEANGLSPLGRKNALLIQVGHIGKSCIYTGNGTDSGTQLLQALSYLDVKSDGKFVIVTPSQKGQMFLDETKEKPYAHGAEVAGFRKHVTY